MRRAIVAGGLLLAALPLAGAGGFSSAAQMDLFLARPLDADALRRGTAAAVARGISAAAQTLGAERVAKMLPPVPGSALADEPERRVLKAVEVTTVAPDRVRITVAAEDMLAGHAVAGSVASSLAATGLRERMRLSSETRGNGMAGIAWAVLGFALVILVARAVSFAIARSNGRSGDA